MRYENPVRMVRELKGAPISIVIALSMVNMRVTQEWLERSTGYTDKPVSQALAYLREIGMADKTSSGWQLTGEAQQLPLPVGQLDEESEREDEEPFPSDEDGAGDEINEDSLMECDGSRNISDSLSTVRTTTDINNKFNKDSVVVRTTGRNFSDSGGDFDEAVDKSVDYFDQNMAAMRQCGINQNRKTLMMAKMPHVTPAYIQGHVVLAGPDNLGLAITRMMNQEPAPEVREETGHLIDCHCRECERVAYAKWEG